MTKFTVLLCALSISGGVAFAQETGKKVHSEMKMPAMTAEQRQKMAEAHDKMASCLRSEKPMNECHEDMMKSCHENMGKEGCPMMSGKGAEAHKH
jgi:hypothetical protein